MNILDSKSKIKVLLIGRDNITRKHFVDHDETFFENKYRIDPDAIILTTEPGFLGFGGSTVPTIIFRENSIEPISKKSKGTIPTPQEFGENVAKAAHAIAVLRAQKDSMFQTMVIALLIGCILVAGVGAYMGYDAGKKTVDGHAALAAQLTAIDSKITTSSSPVLLNRTGNAPNGIPLGV
jgi:hypothetical protein